MNLGPSSANPPTRRPFQDGRVLGDQSGVPAAEDVEWVVDTGADIVTLWDSIGSRFDVVSSIGATASSTTGGAMHVVTGIDAEFEAEDAAGHAITLRAAGKVAVKSNDAGYNLLGVQQLASVGVSVEWDPSARSGTLRR